jgi:hypothetical protein
LLHQNWFVYSKPPVGGPQHVLHYLGRYTRRVGISNHRIVAFSAQVIFRSKDYAHGSKQTRLTVTSGGVSAALPSSCASAWHPLVRFPGQPTAQDLVDTRATTSEDGSSSLAGIGST